MATILIVEDDRDTAESLARWLKLLGHEVLIARDGPKALDVARRQRPDVVLLDIGLPGLDGYEVARRLREEECCKDVVIIAISGYGREEDHRRALAVGCDYHFLKPSYHEALIGLLSASKDGPPPEVNGHVGRLLHKVSRRVEVTNALGLDLRAAAKFVELARRFRADVRVACDGREASGRSILELTTLAAANSSRLELEADGPDAEAALAAMAELIGRRFDEEV